MNTALSVYQTPLVRDLPLCRKEKSGHGGADSRQERTGLWSSLQPSDGYEIPALAYNKDLQEDKGKACSIQWIPSKKSLDIMAGMLSSMTVNKEKMLVSTQRDFSNATELADYLAKKGLPFREPMRLSGSWCWNAARQAIIYRIFR